MLPPVLPFPCLPPSQQQPLPLTEVAGRTPAPSPTKRPSASGDARGCGVVRVLLAAARRQTGATAAERAVQRRGCANKTPPLSEARRPSCGSWERLARPRRAVALAAGALGAAEGFVPWEGWTGLEGQGQISTPLGRGRLGLKRGLQRQLRGARAPTAAGGAGKQCSLGTVAGPAGSGGNEAITRARESSGGGAARAGWRAGGRRRREDKMGPVDATGKCPRAGFAYY
eukprot:364764-Chlamydomonas_euryale.AAC.8